MVTFEVLSQARTVRRIKIWKRGCVKNEKLENVVPCKIKKKIL